MRPSFWQRLDRFARDLTPFALTFVLLVINAVPMQIPGFAQVAPLLPMIGIYFWAVYRPDLMPAAAVFLIGILHDFLSGLPVGVSALTFPCAFSLSTHVARSPALLCALNIARTPRARTHTHTHTQRCW